MIEYTTRCHRAPFGWRCSRIDYGHVVDHLGPCAAWPRWWNLPARLRMR